MFVLCCVASPADVRVVEPEPVSVRLLPVVCKRPHPLPLLDQVASNR